MRRSCWNITGRGWNYRADWQHCIVKDRREMPYKSIPSFGDALNRSAKRYINICCICGHKGYSPVIEQDDFCITRENKAVYSKLSRTLCKLEFKSRCGGLAEKPEESRGYLET